MKQTKQYSFNGLAGCVTQRRSRQTGHMVGLFHSEQAGLDPDGGPWSTVCEKHSAVVAHPTMTLAESHLADPLGWCEECRDGQEAKDAAADPDGHAAEVAERASEHVAWLAENVPTTVVPVEVASRTSTSDTYPYAGAGARCPSCGRYRDSVPAHRPGCTWKARSERYNAGLADRLASAHARGAEMRAARAEREIVGAE